MAITFPTAAQAAAQNPSNTFSPTTTPLVNTSNSFTYIYDSARGVWTSYGTVSSGGLGTVTSVTAGNGLVTSLPASAPITTTGTISINSSLVTLKTASTGATILPAGPVGDRPVTPTVGNLRWNTTTNVLEVYAGGTGWRAVLLAP
jgi:hypothetical protein